MCGNDDVTAGSPGMPMVIGEAKRIFIFEPSVFETPEGRRELTKELGSKTTSRRMRNGKRKERTLYNGSQSKRVASAASPSALVTDHDAVHDGLGQSCSLGQSQP